LGIILVLLLGLESELKAQPFLTIKDDFKSEMLGSFLAVLEDPEGSRSIHDIAKNEANFHPVKGEIPLYSFSPSAYWFRFVLNNTEPHEKQLFLQIGCAWLDLITLYRPLGDQEWSREDIGDTLPYDQRKIRSVLPTFALTLPAGSQQVFYLRVQTADAFIMPAFLRSQVAHYEHESLKEYMSGVLFGLIGVMCIFNLIVYIFSRDLAYLLYAINLMAWFSLFFTLDGYAFAWLWQKSGWWTNLAYVYSILMSTIWGTLFAKEFLRTKEKIPRINRVINLWLLTQILLVLVSPLIPYSLALILACVSTVFFCMGVPATALLVMRQGFRPARYYFCSWVFPACSAFYYLAIIFGVFSANGINIYSLHLGIALEVILLSVALGDRMRQLTEERQDLQQGLEVARVVQESFLLKEISSTQVDLDFIYRPSEALGGDWFACIEREDQQRLYVCFGDVTGHGIATSLITGSAAGSFQTAVLALPDHFDLPQSALTLAHQLNETILRLGARQDTMMTCALLVIDLAHLDCLYLNAGHVNIFVKSADTVQPYLRRGSALGFSRDPQFHPLHLRLSPDDILILYSDGLVENRSHKIQNLSLRRLTRIIQNAGDMNQLKSALTAYTDHTGWQNSQHDDSTVLMLGIKAMTKADLADPVRLKK
jgi:serine phosphatase RsbU (regulator of sigma subunit)